MGFYKSLETMRSKSLPRQQRRDAADEVLSLLSQHVRFIGVVKNGGIDADDVVQGVLQRLLGAADVTARIRSRHPDDSEEELDQATKAYVRKMATNAALDMWRRAKRRGKTVNIDALAELEGTDAGLFDFERIVDNLYSYAWKCTKSGKTREAMSTAMDELKKMWRGETSLEKIAEEELARKRRLGHRSTKKREYDSLCQRHANFRKRLRDAVGSFVENQDGNLIARSVVELALDELFPRRKGARR